MATITDTTHTIRAADTDSFDTAALPIVRLDVAPTVSVGAATNITPTSADIPVTVDTRRGAVRIIATDSATPPGVSSIRSGTIPAADPDDPDVTVPSASLAIADTGGAGDIGEKTVAISGLTEGQLTYIHAIHDFDGWTSSAVDSSLAFTPSAQDSTAPVISIGIPTMGESTADFDVTTDEGNGTLYRGAWPDGATPDAAAVKAGTGAAVHGSQAVAATGAQGVSLAGLSIGTAYEIYAVHEDAAGNLSTAATVGVTTDAAASTDPEVITAAVLSTSSDSTTYSTPTFPSPEGAGLLIAAATCSSVTGGDSFTANVVKVSDGTVTPMTVAGGRSSGNRTNSVIFYLPTCPAGDIRVDLGVGSAPRGAIVVPIHCAGFNVLGQVAFGEGTSGSSVFMLANLSRSLNPSVAFYALARQPGAGAIDWGGATALANGSYQVGTSAFNDPAIDVAYRVLDGTAADNVVPSWASTCNYAYRVAEMGS